MNAQKPVIVYAASGYTGKLACEALTELRIPFVAAGRNQAKLDALVNELRARGADCDARVAEHTPTGLRALFRGSRIVVNYSGPFSLLGNAVVDAALVEGLHYVDSTGEQDFMLDVRKQYGAAFAQQRLLLAPSAAFLWGVGTVAAELCLETPGIDSLEIVYAPPSLQTVSSLQSMIRAARRGGIAVVDGKTHVLPPAELKRQDVPGMRARNALRTAAGDATFFLDNPRVKNCDTWFANDRLARIAPFFGLWSRASNILSGDTLDRWSDDLTLKFKKDPPLEDRQTSRFVVAVTGEGGGRRNRVVMNGTSCYELTGFLTAVAVQAILEGKTQRFGYQSLAQAFGTHYMLSRLEERGTTATVEAEGRTESRDARRSVTSAAAFAESRSAATASPSKGA